MASELRDLRIRARRAGHTDPRSSSKEELEAFLSNGSSKTGKAKKSGKVVKSGKVKRGPGRPRKDETEDAPKKRGRPKGSKNKVAEVEKPKRGRPAKVKSSEAPKKVGRPAKAISSKSSGNGKVGRPKGSGNGTRNLIANEIDWDADFDFREGSTAQYILTQLRKSAEMYEDTADIRKHTMTKLLPKVGQVEALTFIDRSTGKPHKGKKAEEMFKYRVHRTAVDYAIQTGQHGDEGGSKAKKTSKAAPSKGKAKKVTEDAPKKRGRPKGSTTKATGKKRGRPKGSKNKK